MDYSYTSIETSKTGLKIPLKDKLSICSRYNPEKESENLISSFVQEDLFFVTAGFGSGLQVKKLLEQNKYRKIIVVENIEEDFEFLKQIELFNELAENSSVILTSVEKLFSTILNAYLPAIYGKLNFFMLRGFENAFPQAAASIRLIIESAIKTISSDFAVQAHFGKIWQKNIFENLKIASHLNNSSRLFSQIKENSGKTAAIIAAGPGLDESISKLSLNRNKYYIFSTDTAYSTLLNNNISPDCVVSIDGQNVSHSHFIGDFDKNAIYLFDLCACSSAVKKIYSSSDRILFFESGHPLSKAASVMCGNCFFNLTAGSGTVTIAAADAAFKAGFKNVEFFGADFSYIKGKSYAKGTYLDHRFLTTQNRIKTSETQWSALMFRTPLIRIDQNIYTTDVLEGYKKSLNFYLEEKKLIAEKIESTFDFDTFIKKYSCEINKLSKNLFENINFTAFYTLLPLMAWFEKSNSIDESYHLARSNSLRYTKLL